MDPVTMALLFGGAQTLKGELFDRPAEERKALLEAEKTRVSPWTHIVGKDYQDPQSLNKGIAGAMQGAAFGQNLEQVEREKEKDAALTDLLKKKAKALDLKSDPQSVDTNTLVTPYTFQL